MLIHGRLLVTEHGFMLDEVKSLLQKALRRKDVDLIRTAATELKLGKRDQLQWKGIVTFIFEDHCLNHVKVLEKLQNLYRSGDKLGCIEILSRCYTCRYSACHQVVAVSDEYRNYETFWQSDTPAPDEFKGLVAKQGGIDIERLLLMIVKRWKKNDIPTLTSLFGLVNMAVKVEKTKLTKAGEGMLLGQGVKHPSLHQLVVSVLYKHAETDEYMKAVLKVCFKFMTIPEVPEGLIMFSALTQKIFKTTVLEKPLPNIEHTQRFWKNVGVLESMPDWAVDKHTYRGKFGNSSAELFKRKYKEFSFTPSQLEEFHGARPKVGVPHFFDVGCICNNDILPENPLWEKTKEIYLSQKKSMQKTAKMTAMYYNQLKKEKSVVFLKSAKQPEAVTDVEPSTSKRKRKVADDKSDKKAGENKKQKLMTYYSGSSSSATTSSSSDNQKLKTDYSRSSASATTDSSDAKQKLKTNNSGSFSSAKTSCSGATAQVDLAKKVSKKPKGPLLQLPTGSGKVYTILDEETQRVYKGPYKSKERMQLCTFLHKATKEIFGDKHTLPFKEEGPYIIFPLLKSKDAPVNITHRAFYDCIVKKDVPEKEGRFVERKDLGIIQLHKLPVASIRKVPVSVWAHFVYRYVLNVGDTGLYNAIATDDLKHIYGIDMEEKRKQVKGDDVINMMFGKLPRSEIVKEIKQSICEHVESFYVLIGRKFDYDRLSQLYKDHGLPDETKMVKERMAKFKQALDRHFKQEVGV